MFFFCLCFFCGALYSQQQERAVFTINNAPVYTTNITRMFHKYHHNTETASVSDITSFVEVVINYHLKLAEAYASGVDTTAMIRRELDAYKKQLIEEDKMVSEIPEALLQEAYERNQYRIHASHIVIPLSSKENSKVVDTSVPFQKTQKIRDQLVSGADFDSLAVVYSSDPSVLINKGDLGWFSVFQMVYPFENATYTTPIGEVSAPFVTQFGYHIVKVHAKEKKKERLHLAHIMVSTAKKSEAVAHKTITKLHQQLQQGASFEVLVKHYSDDQTTSYKKGVIPNFHQGMATGQAFEEVAYGLESLGDFSKPVHSSYGWHIIKLIAKDALPSLPSIRKELIREIRKDKRVSVVDTMTNEAYRESSDAYLETRDERIVSRFKEYKEGVLIFEVMKSQVWDVANKDTIAVRKFYEKNKKVYDSPESYTLYKVSSLKKEVIDAVAIALQEFKTKEELHKKVIALDQTAIFVEEIKEKGNNTLPKAFSGQQGAVTIVADDGLYTLWYVKAVHPPKPLLWSVIAAKVHLDFQNEVEKRWLVALRKKHKVIVNETVKKTLVETLVKTVK